MNSRELKRTMKQRRSEMRASMKRVREEAKKQLAANPLVKRERDRKRLRQLGTLLLLLLIVCFVNCECEAVPPPIPDAGIVEAPDAGTPVKKAEVKPPSKKRKPLTDRIASQPRSAFDNDARPPPSWLADFRLQVAARSPRLSQCFKGAERPGALRWTTAVNPKTGAVSDHEIAPQGPGAGLEFDQVTCLTKVLSDPGYRLKGVEPGSLPDRVSLVIEF